MMKKRMFSSLMAAAALPLMAMNVSAAGFSQLEADKSKVAFQYEQMGVKLDGQFKAFSADLSFDPAKPESAKATLDVELASVDTGSPDADTEVVTKPWFNVSAFPKARFVASSIKPAGGDNYQITGKLSIKGTDKEVSFPATFRATGDQGVFKGSLPIKRGDFAIGEGDWSSFDIVANDVIVNFELAVKAAQ
ncbi:MAG: YceI family protein [Lautropia sp.]|nr:YceI family protein [Lautropia sp.]